MKGTPLIYYFVNNRRYSQTFTNGHLSRMSTSLQWPLIFLADSPYIWACFNLSTMAMATSLQQPLPSVLKVAIVRGSTGYKREGSFSVKKLMVYSYFEKGCRKKCMRWCRKVLWVVLSSLFFKEICKNGTRGHGHMFTIAKGKKQ